MKYVKDLNEQDFDIEIGSQDKLVLVDYWAPWCGPCRSLMPVIEDLAQDFSGEISVCKVDIETEAELRDRFNISSIPALVLYRNGVEVERRLGLQSRTKLTAWIEDHLE